jgi:UDP-glucuronate 4-epimerase
MNNLKLNIENSSLLMDSNVISTYADVTGLIENFRYKPDTLLKVGIGRFVKWYKEFYGDNN